MRWHMRGGEAELVLLCALCALEVAKWHVVALRTAHGAARFVEKGAASCSCLKPGAGGGTRNLPHLYSLLLAESRDSIQGLSGLGEVCSDWSA